MTYSVLGYSSRVVAHTAPNSYTDMYNSGAIIYPVYRQRHRVRYHNYFGTGLVITRLQGPVFDYSYPGIAQCHNFAYADNRFSGHNFHNSSGQQVHHGGRF